VKEILRQRGAPMKTSDIISALRQGGYPIKGPTDEKKIRLTILKNTANFALLSDDHFMLKPKGMAKKSKQANTGKIDDVATGSDKAEETKTPK
jgi:hypothetical protein